MRNFKNHAPPNSIKADLITANESNEGGYSDIGRCINQEQATKILDTTRSDSKHRILEQNEDFTISTL
jgi:hypothetical protein